MFRKMFYRFNRITLFIGGLAILAITLLGGFDIIMTAIIGRPLHGVFEATQTLMVIAVFLGLGMIHLDRAYINVEVGYELLPPRGKRLSEALTLLLMLGFFSALAWRGWSNAIHSWRVGEYTPGVVQFPVYPAKFALAVGATLAVICCLIDLFSGAHFNKSDNLEKRGEKELSAS